MDVETRPVEVLFENMEGGPGKASHHEFAQWAWVGSPGMSNDVRAHLGQARTGIRG